MYGHEPRRTRPPDLDQDEHRVDAAAFWTFLRRGLSKWDQTASLVPSQRYLVQAMVRGAHPETAQSIVELGPGVGVMTRPLLAQMRADARLYTIEIDEPIHRELTRQVTDPRLHAICGSAEHMPALLRQAGHEGKVDAVMSSLGLSLIDPKVRDTILDAIAEVLAPDGVYVQFGYFHTRYIAYSTARGLGGFDYLRYLRARFTDVRRRPVSLNLPPAWVHESRHPRR